MKKILLVLIVLISLLIPNVAFARGRPPKRPPEPVCDDGMITIAPAEWVDEIPAVTHKEHRCKGWFGYGPWKNGPCPRHGCYKCKQRTVVDAPPVPGYWIPPVCETPAPVGEQCGRCSTIKPFTFVEWFDRDGGCDGDWYNERVEYPNDARCGYVAPTPEPTPTEILPTPTEIPPTPTEIPPTEIPPTATAEPTPTYTPEPTPTLEPTPEPTPEPTLIPARPLFPMQLLINYNPPEGWLPYCMVMTGGGVSVERQQVLCGWVADNHPCGGMVYDNDTWACDQYGYYRQPISVLRCLWKRHRNGQRDQASFDRCHGVEAPILDLDRMDDK